MATTNEVKPRILVTKDEAAQCIANAIQKLSMNDNMGAAKELCEMMNPRSFVNPFVMQNQPKAKKTRKATEKPKGPRTIFEKCRIVLLKRMQGNGNERMRNAMQRWSEMNEQERKDMAALYDTTYSTTESADNDHVTNEVHDEEQEEKDEEKDEETQDKCEGEIKTSVKVQESKTQEKKRVGRKKKEDASTSKIEKRPTRKTKKVDKAEEAPIALEKEAYPSEDEKEEQNENVSKNVIYENRISDEEHYKNADDTHDVELRSSDVDDE